MHYSYFHICLTVLLWIILHLHFWTVDKNVMRKHHVSDHGWWVKSVHYTILCWYCTYITRVISQNPIAYITNFYCVVLRKIFYIKKVLQGIETNVVSAFLPCLATHNYLCVKSLFYVLKIFNLFQRHKIYTKNDWGCWAIYHSVEEIFIPVRCWIRTRFYVCGPVVGNDLEETMF